MHSMNVFVHLCEIWEGSRRNMQFMGGFSKTHAHELVINVLKNIKL